MWKFTWTTLSWLLKGVNQHATMFARFSCMQLMMSFAPLHLATLQLNRNLSLSRNSALVMHHGPPKRKSWVGSLILSPWHYASPPISMTTYIPYSFRMSPTTAIALPSRITTVSLENSSQWHLPFPVPMVSFLPSKKLSDLTRFLLAHLHLGMAFQAIHMHVQS